MTESKDHARKVEIADLSAIMKTESGRNVLARILLQCGLYDTTYVKGSQEETVRRSIRRDLGVWLEREIKEAAPGEYFTLLKELEDD